MTPRQGKGKLPRELGALEIMVGERSPDCGVKSGFIPERLILMGTWEKPLCWGSGVRQCPWWGRGGPGVGHSMRGSRGREGLVSDTCRTHVPINLLISGRQHPCIIFILMLKGNALALSDLHSHKMLKDVTETVKRSMDARGQGQGGMKRQNTGDFQGSETILCDTTVMDTCHYNSVQTHRRYNTKSEPPCKLRTWGDK